MNVKPRRWVFLTINFFDDLFNKLTIDSFLRFKIIYYSINYISIFIINQDDEVVEEGVHMFQVK